MAVRPVSSIATRWEPCHVDDLPCVLNPMQAIDLKQILLMTSPERRLAVALAFAGKELRSLITLLDLAPDEPKSLTYKAAGIQLWRWLSDNKAHATHLPLGMAFRLEKVFGVPASILCEWYI